VHSGTQAFLVQPHVPVDEHVQVLHPSSAIFISPGMHAMQAFSVHAHSPMEPQLHVLQPSGAVIVSPCLQAVPPPLLPPVPPMLLPPLPPALLPPAPHALFVQPQVPLGSQVHVLHPSLAAMVPPTVVHCWPSTAPSNVPTDWLPPHPLAAPKPMKPASESHPIAALFRISRLLIKNLSVGPSSGLSLVDGSMFSATSQKTHEPIFWGSLFGDRRIPLAICP
jgi:hypothetical protein